MTQKLIKLKKDYYVYLDIKARRIAGKLSNGNKVTKLLLNDINELYSSAKADSSFKNEKFEAAYHNPISSELEFLIARLLYHYANSKKLDWKIYLRRQVGKTAPDIRIEKNNITLAIIEVKAKAGWIQSFFSSERYKKDMDKLKSGKSNSDPRQSIEKVKKQLEKYYQTYNIKPKQVFVLLPSFTQVHRKRSSLEIKDYDNEFFKNSGLPKKNLILLSDNLSLDLSSNHYRKDYNPTNRFEDFISLLTQLDNK